MPAEEAPGFEAVIKPLFREHDREEMLFAFDLWSYEDVVAYADEILDQLEDGGMPCDGSWPDADVEKVRAWIAAGKPA